MQTTTASSAATNAGSTRPAGNDSAAGASGTAPTELGIEVGSSQCTMPAAGSSADSSILGSGAGQSSDPISQSVPGTSRSNASEHFQPAAANTGPSRPPTQALARRQCHQGSTVFLLKQKLIWRPDGYRAARVLCVPSARSLCHAHEQPDSIRAVLRQNKLLVTKRANVPVKSAAAAAAAACKLPAGLVMTSDGAVSRTPAWFAEMMSQIDPPEQPHGRPCHHDDVTSFLADMAGFAQERECMAETPWKAEAARLVASHLRGLLAREEKDRRYAHVPWGLIPVSEGLQGWHAAPGTGTHAGAAVNQRPSSRVLRPDGTSLKKDFASSAHDRAAMPGQPSSIVRLPEGAFRSITSLLTTAQTPAGILQPRSRVQQDVRSGETTTVHFAELCAELEKCFAAPRQPHSSMRQADVQAGDPPITCSAASHPASSDPQQNSKYMTRPTSPVPSSAATQQSAALQQPDSIAQQADVPGLDTNAAAPPAHTSALSQQHSRYTASPTTPDDKRAPAADSPATLDDAGPPCCRLSDCLHICRIPACKQVYTAGQHFQAKGRPSGHS